jgi:GTP-binding protein EngB required for normal cell division
VLIVDIRHPLKEFDRTMLEFCFATQLPCHVLLTKADKLSRNQATAGAGDHAQAVRDRRPCTPRRRCFPRLPDRRRGSARRGDGLLRSRGWRASHER